MNSCRLHATNSTPGLVPMKIADCKLPSALNRILRSCSLSWLVSSYASVNILCVSGGPWAGCQKCLKCMEISTSLLSQLSELWWTYLKWACRHMASNGIPQKNSLVQVSIFSTGTKLSSEAMYSCKVRPPFWSWTSNRNPWSMCLSSPSSSWNRRNVCWNFWNVVSWNKWTST